MQHQSILSSTKTCFSIIHIWLTVNLNFKARYKSLDDVLEIAKSSNERYLISCSDNKYWLVYKNNNVIFTREFNIYRDSVGGFIKNCSGIKYRSLTEFLQDTFTN